MLTKIFICCQKKKVKPVIKIPVLSHYVVTMHNYKNTISTTERKRRISQWAGEVRVR